MVGSAFAQNGAFAPYVQGGISYSANAGTSNPSFNGGLGIESSTKHLLLDINGTFQSANPSVSEFNVVQVNGRGYTGSVQGSAYLKVAKHFLVGGGGTWAINHSFFENIKEFGSSETIKGGLDATLQSAHPFVGGGFQTKYNRLLVTYALPGKDALTNERIIPITNEFFVGKHLRLTQTVQLTSYSGNPALRNFEIPGGVRVAAVTAGAGVKFVF
jgi:hypothetical protein